MKLELEMPVEKMLELYLQLEEKLDAIDPRLLYKESFLEGLDESIKQIEVGEFTKVDSIEDLLS